MTCSRGITRSPRSRSERGNTPRGLRLVGVVVVVAVAVAVAVGVAVDLMAVLMGGGATPYEALRDLTLQLYARRLDPAAPSTPRDGTEILIRVMENVTPSQHPRWVAEARWEPGFRASRKP